MSPATTTRMARVVDPAPRDPLRPELSLGLALIRLDGVARGVVRGMHAAGLRDGARAWLLALEGEVAEMTAAEVHALCDRLEASQSARRVL